MKNLLGMAGLWLSLWCGTAAAVEFNRVQANESMVTFAYRQMGVNMEGTFGRFSAEAVFDTDKPTGAHARIEVGIAAIDTGVDEANDEVQGKKWFDTAAHPAARFVSTGVRALGGNRYEATGRLTIKGTTRDVVAPFTFTPSGTRGVFDGALTIHRLDYRIGEGEWADTGIVADEIRIMFHLVLTR